MSSNEDNSTPVVKNTIIKEDDQSSSSSSSTSNLSPDNNNNNNNNHNHSNTNALNDADDEEINKNIESSEDEKIEVMQAGGEDTDTKIIITDAKGKEKDDASVLLVRNDEELPKHYADADAHNDTDIDIDDKKSYLQAQTKEDSWSKKIGMTETGKIEVSDPAEILLVPNDKCDYYADAVHKDIEAATRASPPNRATPNLSASRSNRSWSNRTIPGAFVINNPMFDSSSSTSRRTIVEPRISSLLTNSNTNRRRSYDTGTTASVTISPPSEEMIHEDSSAEQHHIVEAIRVEEQKVFEAIIVTRDDLLSTRDCHSIKVWFYVAIAVLFLLAVVIALSVVLTQQQQHQVIDTNKFDFDTAGELRPPTMAPSNDPYRREAIRTILAPLSGDDVFDINSIEFSPDRNAALDWLVDDNRVLIDNPSLHWKIRQRYILALFYFITNGAGWVDQYHFISGMDECDWSSVTTGSGEEEDLIENERESFYIEGAICNKQGKLERIRMCEYCT